MPKLDLVWKDYFTIIEVEKGTRVKIKSIRIQYSAIGIALVFFVAIFLRADHGVSQKGERRAVSWCPSNAFVFRQALVL